MNYKQRYVPSNMKIVPISNIQGYLTYSLNIMRLVRAVNKKVRELQTGLATLTGSVESRKKNTIDPDWFRINGTTNLIF